MKNINNKIIIYGSGILAILTFGITIIPIKANAYYSEIYGGAGYTNPGWYNGYNNFNQNYYQTPIYVPSPTPTPVSTPTIYSSNTNPNQTNTNTVTRTTD